jgi:hypothetical protein
MFIVPKYYLLKFASLVFLKGITYLKFYLIISIDINRNEDNFVVINRYF